MEDGPEPWLWEKYEEYLNQVWPALLARNPSEAEVQAFLELHPCLVPGGEGGGDSIGGHHGPFPDVLVSQPELPGLRRPVPDFMWISKVSGQVHPVLIEIEAPSKQWFRGDGVTTPELGQALGQLASWRTWFAEEANRLNFYKRYGISDWVRDDHEVRPVYCLIYGRRSEFEAKPESLRQRTSLQPDWAKWMTYDRLRPNAGSRNAACVSVSVSGWKVKSVPPTFRLGPGVGETLLAVPDGWEDAIAANPLMSGERRGFLLSRLDYWREWARSPRQGASRVNDWE
jgi:hypothetical protein